ncbi:gamma carbonic anhydrase family protein [bacterium]|nr:gamma carbonic anhydrase family protein [bacterium]
MIYQLDDKKPVLAEDVYLAPGSAVIGDVHMAEACSVWFNAVIRADVERISVGKGSNVQDGAVLHADPGVPLTIGENVTVGHQVMLHGCTIGDNTLIGIAAVVLNRAQIGKYCIIGANALVTEGTVIPDYSLVVGSPAKVKRSLSDEEKFALEIGAEHYQHNGRRFNAGLKALMEEAAAE